MLCINRLGLDWGRTTMKHRLWGLLLVGLLAACNLSTQPRATAPTATTGAVLSPSVTPLALTVQPTLAPPPLSGAATLSPGALCQVYITYSGADPDNLLSLRAQPSVSATQVLKLPNNTNVLRVPTSQEIEADGYHWLNIIYFDSNQQRYQGWTARDSFATNGVRDPLIVTLRATNQQSPC